MNISISLFSNYNMKKIICLFAIIYSLSSSAQPYKLTWGPAMANEKMAGVIYTAPALSAPFYSVCQWMDYSGRTFLGTYRLFSSNDKLANSSNTIIQKEVKGMYLHVLGLENTGKNLLYFFEHWSGDQVLYEVSVLDYSGKILNTTQLYSMPAKEYDTYSTVKITANPAKNKFLLCLRADSYSAQSFQPCAPNIFMATCDGDGKKLWSRAMTYKSDQSSGIFIFDQMITDAGDAYLIYKKFTNSKCHQSDKDEATKKKIAGYNLQLAKFGADNSIKTTDIEKGVFISSAKLIPAGTHIRCLALYSNDDGKYVTGALNCEVEDGKILYNKKGNMPVDEQTLSNYRRRDEIEITNAHTCSDGSVYLITECSNNIGDNKKAYPGLITSSNPYSSGHSSADPGDPFRWIGYMNNGLNIYVSFGISVFRFDKDGNFVQSKFIQRYFLNVVTDFCNGVFSAVVNDKLYLVYNAYVEEDNNNHSATGGAHGSNLKDYGCILNSFDKNLNMDRKVLYNYEGTKTLFVPTLSYPIAGNKLLLLNSVFMDWGKIDRPNTNKYAIVSLE